MPNTLDSGSDTNRSRIRNVVVAAILICAMAIVISRWAQQVRDVRGKQFPSVSLQPLTGNAEVVNTDDLVGKVVLINFWGTWCPPCRLELPQIVQIYEKYQGNQDFLLLSVSCGQGEEDKESLRQNTESMLQSEGIDMPTYADPSFASRAAVADAIGFTAYPTTFVLDRKGVIQGEWVGYHSSAGAEMEQLVGKLLESDLEKPEGN